MKKDREKKSSAGKKVAAVIIIIIVLAAVGVACYFYSAAQEEKANKPVITTAEVVDVVKENELLTTSCRYNSIVVKYDEESKENEPVWNYKVSYEGIVKMGLDLDTLTNDSLVIEENNITLTIPKAEVMSCAVLPDSIDFIFRKDKFDNEETVKEAGLLCQEDLKNKISGNEELLKRANENNVNVVKNLVDSVVNIKGNEYTINVKVGE